MLYSYYSGICCIRIQMKLGDRECAKDRLMVSGHIIINGLTLLVNYIVYIVLYDNKQVIIYLPTFLPTYFFIIIIYIVYSPSTVEAGWVPRILSTMSRTHVSYYISFCNISKTFSKSMLAGLYGTYDKVSYWNKKEVVSEVPSLVSLSFHHFILFIFMLIV